MSVVSFFPENFVVGKWIASDRTAKGVSGDVPRRGKRPIDKPAPVLEPFRFSAQDRHVEVVFALEVEKQLAHIEVR